MNDVFFWLEGAKQEFTERRKHWELWMWTNLFCAFTDIECDVMEYVDYLNPEESLPEYT